MEDMYDLFAQHKQVVVRISHILGNFQVPARSGGSEAKQCQKGLEPSRFHIEGISWILTEWPGDCTVDSQALSGEKSMMDWMDPGTSANAGG